jgi:hypothetical protein
MGLTGAMYREDLLAVLAELDGDLLASYGMSRRFEMTIVGGGALILLGVLAPERVTMDIDVLEVPQELYGFLERYNMNAAVATFAYDFPEHWRERRQKLPFHGDCLDVYTMSLEDLVLSKLMAYRASDRQDLQQLAKSESLDWNKLAELVDNPLEFRVNMETEDDWQDFLERYEVFKTWRQG